MHDYYEVLGLQRDADPAAVKRAFRELARRYHPDHNGQPDAEERFKELAEAYAVLSDADKRARYDATGVAASPHEDVWRGVDFEEALGGLGRGLFERVFGRKRAPLRGGDVELELTIGLSRVLGGGKETVRLPRPETCKECQGTGARAGTEPRACAVCKGAGHISRNERRGDVVVRASTSCSACDGRGRHIDAPCPACQGEGRVTGHQLIEVHVPPGIEDGTVLRLAARGLPSTSPGGMPGDALVIVHVRAEPGFVRRGRDVWCNASVSAVDAVLGTRLRVETLEAPVEVSVPSGTQPGSVLRVRGKGLPPAGGGRRGDLYVVIDVHMPRHLRQEERRLYEKLRALSHEAPEAARHADTGAP